MDWITNHLVTPLLNVLYVPCDWVLGWTERFPAIVAISIVGVISGLLAIVLQKFASDQAFLGRCKEDLAFQKKRMSAAKAADDAEALQRARSLSGKISGKQFLATLKPSMWSVPLIGIIAAWTGSRLGSLPIRPGEEVSVVAHFEDQAKGYAYILPNDALTPVSPLIAPIVQEEGGGQARWTFKARSEGEHRLTLRAGGLSRDVAFSVTAKGGHPSEPLVKFVDSTPAQDQLQAVQFKLADSLPAAWWNLKLQWMGPYLVIAMGVWLLLKWFLKVH